MLALLCAISLIDLATHRIPHRLIALIPLLGLPHLHLNPWILVLPLLLFLLTDMGGGDLKLVAALSTITPQISLSLFSAGFFVGVLIALLHERSRGPIPLAPALVLGFIVNM